MELDDGATIFCFDATVECKLDVETIVADIEKMLPIGEVRCGLRRLGTLASRSKGAGAPVHPQQTRQGHLRVAFVVGGASRPAAGSWWGEVRGGQGAAEQVALQPIAAGLRQPGLLLRRLHPFGGDFDAELVAQTDDRSALWRWLAWLVASPWVKLLSSLRVATCSLGR